jgi:hypothetical protein
MLAELELSTVEVSRYQFYFKGYLFALCWHIIMIIKHYVTSRSFALSVGLYYGLWRLIAGNL